MRRASELNEDALRCSFCHKSQSKAGRLISSPSDYPRAYICDECVQVCMMIIDDDRADATAEAEVKVTEQHPLLDHPLASELMECVAQWVAREALGQPAPEELARLRSVARQMFESWRP